MQETQETWDCALGQEDSLEEEMVTHSCILAWKIPWTEEFGQLLSMGLQRVEHDWSDLGCKHAQSELEDIIKTFSLTFSDGELDGLFLDSMASQWQSWEGWETHLSHPWIPSPTSHWCISRAQVYLHSPVNTGVSRVRRAGSPELLVWMWFWTSCLGRLPTPPALSLAPPGSCHWHFSEHLP